MVYLRTVKTLCRPILAALICAGLLLPSLTLAEGRKKGRKGEEAPVQPEVQELEGEDPLRDIERVLRSRHGMQDKKQLSDLGAAHWFGNSANFARLFRAKRPGELLIKWVGEVIPGFIGGNIEDARKYEFIHVTRPYSGQSGARLQFSVIIPHPRYLESAELDLITEFRDMRPPTAGVSEQEKIVISEVEWTFTQSDRGECFLHTSGARGSRAELRVKDCANRRELISLAELLNMKRLYQKLES